MSLLLALVLMSPAAAARAVVDDMVQVGPGAHRLAFPSDGGPEVVPVAAFLMDRTPVTVEAWLGFVRSNARWQRDRVSRLFADEGYLGDWAGPLEPGPGIDPQAPVTQVSWFAARAYCEARGARLPTELEWEFAASADERRADARDEPAFVERILGWYAARTPARLPSVGRDAANLWGVRDLHGLVWEWVLDFNAAMVTGDSREGGAADGMRFCGASALGARDARDYASFMRAAFRSSLEARFTTRNLGFRCARDITGGKR
jgi:sulfatase modifying factor 1